MSLSPPAPPALARIAAIEARFDPASATALGSAGLGSTSNANFQTVLDALSGGDSTSGSGTRTANAGTASGNDVVNAGLKYLGVPYKWGGTNPESGLDCSGFVQRAYADVGVTLPRVSRDQATVGAEVPSLTQAQPGDLVAFGQPVDHIAIYAGDGKIIQAPHTGEVVSLTPIRRNDIATIRRILPAGTSVAGSTGPLSSSPLSSSPLSSSPLSSSPMSPTPLSSRTTASTGELAATTPYRDLFVAAGQKYGLDPKLLAAVGKVESNFNPSATSPVGATGLMQFMPSTAAGMGIDPSDPAQAIDGAGRYLSAQVSRFGSVDLALAAYNAGPRAVERAGGIPPYPETQNYVVKVKNAMNQVSE